MTRTSTTRSLMAAAGFLVASAATSSAAVVGFSPNADLSASAFTVDLGAASYTFSDSGELGAFGFGLPAISTIGTATVASLGAPFYDPPRPSTYFTDEGRAPFIDGSLLGQYVAYDTPAAIPFAETDSFLALSFTLDDGVHYGFARVAGLSLFDFAYESEAGVGIQAGPIATTPSPVPLPATLPLAASALAGMAFLARRRRTV